MNNFKQQVSLLLQVLPEVAKEPDFARHGIYNFSSHSLKYRYSPYFPTYPNDDKGFQTRLDVFSTYQSYPLGKMEMGIP